MRRVVFKSPVVQRGIPAKSLVAFLLALAMMIVLCPTDSIPAQAAAVSGTLGRTDNDTGIIVHASIGRDKIRVITLQKGLPNEKNYQTCWNASEEVDGDGGASVIGCAAEIDNPGTYNVVYGAEGAYPRFPDDSSHLFSTGITAWPASLSLYPS